MLKKGVAKVVEGNLLPIIEMGYRKINAVVMWIATHKPNSNISSQIIIYHTNYACQWNNCELTSKRLGDNCMIVLSFQNYSFKKLLNIALDVT